MKSSLCLSVLLCSFFIFLIATCFADDAPVQDLCPTACPSKGIPFINGLPCKNPATASPSDFKTSILNHAGETENFMGSSMRVVTASDFPGLNTLGISLARTDLAMDGIVMPHSHPRASEVFYVSSGVVLAGFIDTQNRLFNMTLRQGDVFVVPRGLLHFYLNAGYELATIFSVQNSQNPGVVSIVGAMFNHESDKMKKLLNRLRSFSALQAGSIANVTMGSLLV